MNNTEVKSDGVTQRIPESQVCSLCNSVPPCLCVGNPLHNPVYNALLSGDSRLAFGEGEVRYFHEDVSPFAGFNHEYQNGFSDLYEQLPAGRSILYANPSPIQKPKGWLIRHEIKGLQFVYQNGATPTRQYPGITALHEQHIEEMVQLATLTKPGPFGPRTIDFGSYFGIFEQGKLVAMTGQRLHVDHYLEISAVCTHPEHTGKGYAFHLIEHQLQLILEKEQQPFLHVREDNERAISLYKRMGFVVSRPMIFYFMKRE